MKLAWESHGEGAPLLLVQGLGYTRSGWGPARERLSERFRVVSYDNRGIGESDVPPGPYTVEELGGDAVQVLDEAGIERAHVVGASLGGMVAQHVAVNHADRVEKLVLACTHPGGTSGFAMPQVTVDLFARAGQLDPAEALRAFVANSLGPDAPPTLAEEIVAYRTANPPDPLGWQAQAAAGAAFGGVDLERVRAPTLVLTGTADNVVDHRNADVLAAGIPRARLERLEGAGHLFFWERPAEFARLVAEFLA